MQIYLLFIGVSKELLDEFFGKVEPLYFTYRKNSDLLLVSRETLAHLQVLTCKGRQNLPSNSENPLKLKPKIWGLWIWAHWLKGFPHSRRGMEGQTWVPQEYNSLLFPSSSNKSRQPGEIQVLPDISFHRAHSWGSWAGWLFCGHYKCRCIQQSSWPAKNVNVALKCLSPGFIK